MTVQWTTLIHNGILFPPPYIPHGIKMLYKGNPVDLTPEQEEVATMYVEVMDGDAAKFENFKENFMNDWRKLLGQNHVIQNFYDCDFTPIYDWIQREREKNKRVFADEQELQETLKEERLKREGKYMWAIVDGVKRKVENYRLWPPPMLWCNRGRLPNPKAGKVMRRILPSDITINIGEGAPIPECPIPGESWKEVRHDNTVSWLAFWEDPLVPGFIHHLRLSRADGQEEICKSKKAKVMSAGVHTRSVTRRTILLKTDD